MNQRRYHHGDLRNALLAATLDLVRERGPRVFSVSEAARRVGVSSSAPYRHFRDRDAMLAAAALQGFAELELRFARLPAQQSFTDRASQIAVEYVRFAREDPARFEVMFGHGMDKAEHPDLLRQTFLVQERLEASLDSYLAPMEVTPRAAELWSLAHGIADLALGGNLQHVVPEEKLDALAISLASSWARGLRGAVQDDAAR
jgi:AcrR family transcriptional regulator